MYPKWNMPVHTQEKEMDYRQLVKQSYIEGSKRLKNHYISQDVDTWTRINAALKRVIMSEICPASIIFIYNDYSRYTTNCLVQQLANTINKSYMVDEGTAARINITETYDMTSNDYKIYMDEKVRENFHNGSKVVLLYELHNLSGNSAKLLHGFCDTDNAPFKDASYLFTLYIPDAATDTKTTLEKTVERRLQGLWEEVLGKDNLHALLSRISNNVVLIKAEHGQPC